MSAMAAAGIAVVKAASKKLWESCSFSSCDRWLGSGERAFQTSLAFAGLAAAVGRTATR
jgi:hypothetical protein